MSGKPDRHGPLLGIFPSLQEIRPKYNARITSANPRHKLNCLKKFYNRGSIVRHDTRRITKV